MTALSSDLSVNAFFRFSVEIDPKNNKPIDWLDDKARRNALGEAIFSVPLFRDRLKLGKAEDAKLAPITAKTGPAIVGTSGDVLSQFQNRAGRDRDLFVQVHVARAHVEIRIQTTAAGLAGHEESALDDLVAVGQRVAKALHGVAGLIEGRVQADYAQRTLDYPRSRPPKESPLYPERSIVTFIDRGFHATSDARARPDVVKALTVPAPPPPATMSNEGDLITVRWARTLGDQDLIAAAAGHEAWISSRIDAEIAEGYNELGDQREVRGDGGQKPPLTFYSTTWRIGYKAVLVLPDGSVEQDGWNDAVAVAKAKKLPDGTPVDSVRIVVPLREHVFMVAARAKQAGLDGVLYPDDSGVFWDPDPPGNWLTPPDTTAKSPKRKGSTS